MEACGERESVRKSLFEVEGAKDVLHVLRIAFVVTILLTVVDEFSFKDDAINSLEVHFDTASERSYEIFRHVHECNFAKEREEVRDNRSADLERHVVCNLGVVVVNLVENVAAVAELDVKEFKAREVVEVEHQAEVTLVQVSGLADKGEGDVHVFASEETEFELVFRILCGEESVFVTIDVATEVVTILVRVVPTTYSEAEPILALVSPCFVKREVIFSTANSVVFAISLQITRIEGDSKFALKVVGFGEDGEVGLTTPLFEVVRVLVVFGCPENLACFEFKVCVDVEVNFVDSEDGVFNHLLFLAACSSGRFCSGYFSRSFDCGRNFNSRSGGNNRCRSFCDWSCRGLDFGDRGGFSLRCFWGRSECRNNRFCRSLCFYGCSGVGLDCFCLCFNSLGCILSLDFGCRSLFCYSGFCFGFDVCDSCLCCFRSFGCFLGLCIGGNLCGFSGLSCVCLGLFNLSFLLCCYGFGLGNSGFCFYCWFFGGCLNIFCTRCCKYRCCKQTGCKKHFLHYMYSLGVRLCLKSLFKC
ncbi:hypothetical protein FSU_0121 [Fibrobacter succinogenes subsp. succinogenes S85]|uniref:Uncharacterized protein n=1 Tax=Fibrobacter succinogenes (strain ATCC 19169 / S85) TaxID=59374 RepID=D9S4I4_FIBSS|nr:hypothetical protein FSU_0121 [Fibrobacter succinogenes subsp. succinogenes S85]